MATWHVLHTRSGWEKRTAILCARKKIEVFIPATAGTPGDSRRKTSRPLLFPSYVFASLRPEDYMSILRVEGVIGLVHWLRSPVIVPTEEIDAIKTFLGMHRDISVRRTGVGTGMRMYRSEDRLWLPSLGYVLMPAPLVRSGASLPKRSTNRTI